MGRDIGNDLRGSFCTEFLLFILFFRHFTVLSAVRPFFRLVLSAPGFRASEDLLFHPCRAVNESGQLCLQCGSLDGIPGIVAEHPDILVQETDILLQRRHCAALHGSLIGSPGFSEQELYAFSVPAVKLSSDPVHQIHIQKTHQIKPEPIDMVFLRPVEHGLQDKLCAHLPLACHIISAGRTIGDPSVIKHTVEIPGRGPLEPGIQRICMIVYNIHDHAEPLRMKRLDHLFHLTDANLPVSRIRGVGAFRDVVIHRVVSPVELRILSRLVDRTVIVGRHDLNMGHSKVFQVRDPRRMDAVIVERSIRTGKRLVFSPVFLREPAGPVPGKLLDMELIDDPLRLRFRSPVCFPSLRICAP